jgi:hypothetical protein
MADYRLTETDAVIRTADNAHIPNHPDNRDWIEYQAWLAAGGVPDPVKPPISPALDAIDTGKTAAEILGV